MVHAPNLNSKTNWLPNATHDTLQRRAQLLNKLRDFFYQRQVQEVDTPLLSQFSVAAAQLQPVIAHLHDTPHYLQTSPEYAMKRLLAAGSGCIYQLGKAFRHGERGRLHNPEFTMLEWYRVDHTLAQLLTEVSALLQTCADTPALTQADYGQLFIQHIGLNPHTATLTQLQQACIPILSKQDHELPRADLQALLFNHYVESKLGHDAPIAVIHFPEEQAELATLTQARNQAYPVAERAEIYWRGIELANGYQELNDADELQQRWLQKEREFPQPHPNWTARKDPRLLAALQHGLPPCAGIALGVDRLLMLMLGKSQVDDVLSFAIERA
jgi:lysyl-tRNA synthetase class 2